MLDPRRCEGLCLIIVHLRSVKSAPSFAHLTGNDPSAPDNSRLGEPGTSYCARNFRFARGLAGTLLGVRTGVPCRIKTGIPGSYWSHR